MQTSIHEAAEHIRNGNHLGAQKVISALERTSSLNDIIAFLKSEVASRESTYVQFVALKLLRVFLVQQRRGWLSEKAAVLQFLVDYAHTLGDRVLSREWHPTVCELAASVAAVLKLGCVTADLQASAAEVSSALDCLITGTLFVGSPPSPADHYFHRAVCQRTVEEFGLFDGPSRLRGLPSAVHRQCRLLFEDGGRLAQLILAVLRALVRPSAVEIPATVDMGFRTVAVCLSWPSHRFFEEDSVADEVCTTFTVAAPSWDELFFHPLGADVGAPSLFALLSRWYMEQSIGGVPVARQRVAEVAQLLCSFKGATWEERQSAAFLTASFALCMNIFEKIAVNADAADFDLLPVLANSLLRLVTNYTECMLSSEMVQLLGRFSEMTRYLIEWDAKVDEDRVMSSLDEVLSAWYHLASFVVRGSSVYGGGEITAGSAVMRESCSNIFTVYLECKTAACIIDEDEDGFADAFANSHLELIAHIGRVSAGKACRSLAAALAGVMAQTAAAGPRGGVDEATAARLSEAVWLIVRATALFIADKSDGEEPYIPRCFQDVTTAPALVSLTSALMSAGAALFSSTSCVTSPAVYAAYATALRAYCRSYVEPEEDATKVYAAAIGGGADFVAFALQFSVATLRFSPFEADAMDAVCALLDSIADKSADVRRFACGQQSFQEIAQLAIDVERWKFVGHTRGRLLAFLVTCSASDSQSTSAAAQDALHPLLAASARRDASVNELLECLTSVAGLFESLHRQDVIRAVSQPVMSVVGNLLRSSFDRFHERELAVEVVQCVHSMFTACVPVLESPGIVAQLQFVALAEGSACQALRSTSNWHTVEAESDRVAFLSWIARLVSAVAQWRLLDCFLPDEDVQPVATATVETLATLLGCLDQRALCYPELEDTLFTALETCAEAFPVLVVLSPHADAFFSATFYALTSDRGSTQRAGVSVANHAADCLDAEAAQGSGGAAALLRVMAHSLATGKVQTRNIRLVAKTVLKLAVKMGSPEAIKAVLGSVAAELPGGQAFLEALLSDLTQSLLAGPPSTHGGDHSFEVRLEDNLSLMKGISLI